MGKLFNADGTRIVASTPSTGGGKLFDTSGNRIGTTAPSTAPSGKLFNADGSRVTSGATGSTWSYAEGLAAKKEELQGLKDIAAQAGIATEDRKPKVSNLDKVFGLLSAAETAPLVYEGLKTGDWANALKKQKEATAQGLTLGGMTGKKTYEDVLVDHFGMKRGLGTKVAGIAGDIALDPTTYLGGAIIKGGGKVLSKVGGAALKVGKKSKILEPLIEGAAKSGREIAGLFSKKQALIAAGVPTKVADDFLDTMNKSIKLGRWTEAKAKDEIADLVRTAVKESGPDAGIKIAKAIESPTVMYHGGAAPSFKDYVMSPSKNYGGSILPSPKGIYVTDSVEAANKYRDMLKSPLSKDFLKEAGGKEPKVIAGIIDPKAKILDLTKDPEAVFKVDDKVFIGKLKKSGYDGAKFIDEWDKSFSHPTTVLWSNKSIKDLVEPVGTKLSPQLTKAKDLVQDSFKNILEREKASGLEVGNIGNYVTHTMTDDARNFVKGFGYDIPALNRALPQGKERKIIGSIDEINKEFRGWLSGKGQKEFDLFEPDAFKALAVRSKSSARAIGMKQLKDAITDKFGLADEVVKRQGQFFKESANIVDGVKYVQAPGFRIPGALGDTVELANKSKVWLPEGIAKELDNMNKIFLNDSSTNALLKGYDTLMNKFKTSVTSVFPAFHANNLKGGIFNNFMAGVKNPERYVDAVKMMKNSDEVVKFGKWSGTYKQLSEEMAKRGAIGGGGYFDAFDTVDSAVKAAMKKNPELINQVKGLPEAVMNGVEGFNRGALAIDTLKKGGTLDDAAKQVFKYHFDYAPEAFTPFERNVMKRLIPFYTWTRNNIPLMVESITKQPGKVAGIGKTIRSMKNMTPEEVSLLPEYMQEGTPMKVGNQIYYGGGLPIEDINRISPRGAVGMLSPVIKLPFERYTGQNFFFNQPIEDFKEAPSWFKSVPQFMKDAFGYDAKTNELDPYKYHLLTTAFGRYVFTADKLADPDTSAKTKVLYGALGVKGRELDPAQLEYYITKDEIEKLGELLKKKGVMREFSKLYVPKESK